MKHQKQYQLTLLTTTTTLFLLLLLLLQPIPTQSNNNTPDLTYIKGSCESTLYPQLCYTSLSRYATSVQQNPARLATAAIAISLSRARRLSSFLSNATHHASSSPLHDCNSTVGDAVDEMHGSLMQMKGLGTSSSDDDEEEEFRFKMSNVLTWMSAALTNEETCTDGFSDVADGQLKTEVCDRVGDVKKFTSNALALVNSYANNRTS